MKAASDHEHFDPRRVETFLDAFNTLTWTRGRQRRTEELDSRIADAGLTLGDTIEAFKRLAATGWQSARDELRMERLICSVAAKDLSLFKYALEYDGDYKDLEEYLCHDIDNEGCRGRVVAHFRTAPPHRGVKVLTDVDDTMYANLVDDRYPRHSARKSFYPGVLEFYDAVKREPFPIEGVPVTTLSARPNPVAGILEEASLKKLTAYSGGRLRPSALSGALVSATIGTLQTFVRVRLDSAVRNLPNDQENEIGITKFKNFANFATVYPEYRYVFVGDSGQADALTAQLMLDPGVSAASSGVITTFVHDLRRAPDDHASPAFRALPAALTVTRSSPTGRGVIVFRDYLEAAVIAFLHAATLDSLITLEGLARVTRAALQQFHALDFRAEGKDVSRQALARQYREHAEEAYRLLSASPVATAAVREDVNEIRRLLDEGGGRD